MVTAFQNVPKAFLTIDDPHFLQIAGNCGEVLYEKQLENVQSVIKVHVIEIKVHDKDTKEDNKIPERSFLHTQIHHFRAQLTFSLYEKVDKLYLIVSYLTYQDVLN